MSEHMKDDDTQALDRELSRLLAIEPSGDFAAKVRARIEQQPARGNGWHLWVLAPLAAVAVIVIAVVMITRKPAVPTSGSPGLQAGRTAPGSAGLQAGRTGAPRAQIPIALPPRSVRHTQQTTRSVRASEPEVLIDPSVARAIRRLATERPVLPEVPREPSLDPVVIEPLRVPDVSEIVNVRSQADQERK